MDVIYEKIKPNGDIHLPKSVLANLGLKVGEEVELSLEDKRLMIQPHKDPIDELTGSISLKDPKLIDEIIESEDWL